MPPSAKRAAAPYPHATERADTKEASLDNSEGFLHISQSHPETSQGQLEIREASFDGTSFVRIREGLARTGAGSFEAQGNPFNSGPGCHEVSPGPPETSEDQLVGAYCPPGYCTGGGWVGNGPFGTSAGGRGGVSLNIVPYCATAGPTASVAPITTNSAARRNIDCLRGLVGEGFALRPVNMPNEAIPGIEPR